MSPRRQFVSIVAAIGAIAAWPLATVTSLAAPAVGDPQFADLHRALRVLERESGGRLGVCVLRPSDGKRLAYRERESFPMCSTFKLLASAAVLQRCDRGLERLDRRMVFTRADLVPNSSVSSLHTGGAGLSIAELCHAAITVSDNTAGNLLLTALGGPSAITRFAASLGDDATRLDRWEPALNESVPGDPRDTTTPAGMLGDLQRLLLGDALSDASRRRLEDWLVANRTGSARLRAKLPADWVVGDKTGSGERGSTHDVALLRPPGKPPIVATVFVTGSTAPAAIRNATIAAVGAIVADAF